MAGQSGRTGQTKQGKENQSGEIAKQREPVRRNRRVDRAAEPVRRRRPVEEDWDVELIGQDRMVRPRRRKQTVQSRQNRKVKKRRAYLHRTVAVCTIVLCLMIAFMAVDLVYDHTKRETAKKQFLWRKRLFRRRRNCRG